MKIKKTLAAVASMAMLATTAFTVPMNAGAAGGGNYSSTIRGDLSTKFDKYLVMHTSAHVPDAAFTYTIEPGDGVTGTETTYEVFAGVGTPVFRADDTANTGSADAGKVVFSNADTTIAEASVAAGDAPAFTTTGEGNTADEKYAKKVLTIDFPNDTPFKEPGIYRYVITENPGTSVPGVTMDPVSTRTLDVYVVDDYDSATNTNYLKFDTAVLYSGTITSGPKKELPTGKTKTDVPNGLEAGDKSAGFTNSYTARTLSFGKEVEGNQGSKDKYFKFTLTIANAAGATLDVTVADMETSTTETSATIYTKAVMDAANNADDVDTIDGHQIKVGTTGTVTKYYYLRDGQYVTISGLPQGATYTLTEAAEDYTSAEHTATIAVPAVGTEGDPGYVAAKTYNDDVSGTIGANDIYTGFTNTKIGLLPTGILLSVAGPAVIGIIALLGIAVLFIRGRRRRAEEE